MAKMSQTQPEMSLRNIIWKYCNYRRNRSAVRDTHLELLGYICRQAYPESYQGTIRNVLIEYPFQQDVLTVEEKEFLIANAREAIDFLCSPTDRAFAEGEFLMQPVELTQLATVALQGLPAGTTVYNPFAGTNSYAITAPQYHFVGEEINPHAWVLGQMRLIAYGVNADIERGDSYVAHTNDKFDAIITTPPFGMRDRDEVGQWERLYDMLNDGGRLVFVTSPSLMFNRRYARLVERWRLDRSIATIIQLPTRMFSFTAVASIMVVIEKKDRHYIRMIDASSMGTVSRHRLMTLNAEEMTLLTQLLQGADASLFKDCIDVPFEAINPTQPLLPSTCLAEASLRSRGLKNLVPLRLLIEPYSRGTWHSSEPVHEIRIKDLAENVLDSTKDFIDLPLAQASDRVPVALQDDHILLIATAGNNPKPTIFRFTKGHTVVYPHNTISAFRLRRNVDIVGMDYIVSELYKPYVKEQFDASFAGAYLAHITADRLLDIRISVPSLEKRNTLAEEMAINEHRIAAQEQLIKEAGIQLRELQDRKHNEYVRIMRDRKHALGQVLNELEPAIKRVFRTMEKNNGVLRATDSVSSRSKRTVEQSLQNIYAKTKRLITMVDCLTDDSEFREPIEISVYDKLEEFKKTLLLNNYDFNIVYTSETGFTTDKSKLEEGKHNYDDYKIMFDPNAFIQVLENITSNAIKYGFTNEDIDYIIQVSTMPTTLNGKKAVEIRIANNGDPLPKGMTPEKVFAPEITSGKGEGRGGWHTKNIVEHYGGTITLEEGDASSEFRIEYVIVLPIIENYGL